MSQLDTLLSLFPEGVKHPTPEAVAQMREIDAAISGTRDELAAILGAIENEYRSRWRLGNAEIWNGFDGTPFARVPEHDGTCFTEQALLQEVHAERFTATTQLFPLSESLTVIEDGGVKSFERAKKKLDYKLKKGRPLHAPDISRVRLVTPGLQELYVTYNRLVRYRDADLQAVGDFSHYTVDPMKKYPTFFRGVLTTWCGLDETNPRDQIATEVQLVTERVRSIMDLDHPFNVAQTIQYPDDTTKEYLDSLMIKASILDFQNM